MLSYIFNNLNHCRGLKIFKTIFNNIKKETLLNEKLQQIQFCTCLLPVLFQYFEHTSESHVRHERFCIFPAGVIKLGASGLFRGDCFEVEAAKLVWNYTEVETCI